MKVGCVNAPVFGATPIRKNSEMHFASGIERNIVSEIVPLRIPSCVILAQMPQVNFSSNYRGGNDDLSRYDKHSGDMIPDIEIKKYNISKDVQRHIENEDYLSAIKGKLELAYICKSQKKENDAFYLEESIRLLYDGLPKYQKNEAKDAIRKYNYDMALYIDEDIEVDRD